jgi:hypothetical protein
MAGSGDRPNRLETASCRAMKRPTRVQVYEGMYRSQADDRFHADALEAAQHGWRAVDEGRWNGEQLAVTYVHEGPGWRGPVVHRAAETKPRHAAGGTPGRSRVRRFTSALVQTSVLVVLVVALVAAVLGVALIADVGGIRDMAQDLPKPIPRLVRDYLEWVKSIRG